MKEIILSQGKVALVDDEDFEWLSKWKWSTQWAPHNYYAVRTEYGEKNKTVYMHREITHPPNNLDIDHINHNGLDNRRENLRFCTTAQNTHHQIKRDGHTSGFKGIYWNKRKKKWQAKIRLTANGISKQIFLGLFDSEIHGALAYDEAAKKYFGDFAELNFRDV